MESSKTHFTVTPLEFVRNLDIEINADKVNGGVEDVAKINDKDKDLSVRFSNEIFSRKKFENFTKNFKAWSKAPIGKVDSKIEKELKHNSTFHGEELRAWIDHINEKSWDILEVCGPPPYFKL